MRIAADERYLWHLSPFESERGSLPAGDYALVRDEAIAAVVERKTFDGLLADFGRLDVLHQRLFELPATSNTLVVETPYAVIWTHWLGEPSDARSSQLPSRLLGECVPSA